MKKINLFVLIFIFIFSTIPVIAQDEKDEIPPGMEVLQEGRIKVIIPKDAKRRQEENLTVVETTQAYASRRFLEMEKRLAQLEAKQKRLKKQVEDLEQALDEIRDTLISVGIR